MKTTLSLLARAVVLAAALLPGTVSAQTPVCFVDNGGFTWDLRLSNNFFTGMVDVPSDSEFDWYATGGRGTNNPTRRHHTFTAINPELSTDPGCGDNDFHADWFTYNGLTGAFNGTGYPYNGSWVNSCGFTGTFSGLITVGACPAPRVVVAVEGGPASSVAPQASADARFSSEEYAVTSAPNPFTDGATISYTIPEQADVRLIVYDALGRQVAVLVDEAQNAGTHTAAFDGASLPAGTYVYHLVTGSHTQAGRMVLVR